MMCGSDLLSQIQNPELVEVVEAGFDHASPEITSIQVHDGCGGQRAQVRVWIHIQAAHTSGTNTRDKIQRIRPLGTRISCPGSDWCGDTVDEQL